MAATGRPSPFVGGDERGGAIRTRTRTGWTCGATPRPWPCSVTQRVELRAQGSPRPPGRGWPPPYAAHPADAHPGLLFKGDEVLIGRRLRVDLIVIAPGDVHA